MTQASTEAKLVALALVVKNSALQFKHVPCIYNQVYFKKDKAKIQAFLDLSGKRNVMILVYTAKLGLKV